MLMGTLIRKIQCHWNLAVIQPPRVGADGGSDHNRHPVERKGHPTLLCGEHVRKDSLPMGLESSSCRTPQDAKEDEQG